MLSSLCLSFGRLCLFRQAPGYWLWQPRGGGSASSLACTLGDATALRPQLAPGHQLQGHPHLPNSPTPETTFFNIIEFKTTVASPSSPMFSISSVET